MKDLLSIYSDDLKACQFLGSTLLLLASIGKEVKIARTIKKANTDNRMFSDVLHYINLNYNEPINLTYLASLFGYTPQYMSGLF